MDVPLCCGEQRCKHRFNVSRGYFKGFARDTISSIESSSAECRFASRHLSSDGLVAVSLPRCSMIDPHRTFADILTYHQRSASDCHDSILFVCEMTALVHPLLVTLAVLYSSQDTPSIHRLPPFGFPMESEGSLLTSATFARQDLSAPGAFWPALISCCTH